ncbi:MAG: dTDP-4-dehydrorhamnose reductase [Balneolales bacterium]
MRSRILLFGAGGQLGTEWGLFLKEKGFLFKSCTSSVVDVTDDTSLRSVFNSYRPDIVINCAAFTDVDLAEDEPEEAREVNAEAVAGIAKLCEDAGAKLVHYSSDYVFPGNVEDRERLPLGYPETYDPSPVNTYGLTKLIGEQLLQKYCSNYIIIRTSWLCGSYGSNFVKTMLRLSDEKDELKVVNDQFGTPTFTGNLVENSMALIDADFKGLIHASSSGLTNWHELASAIFEIKNIKTKLTAITTSEYPTKAVRPLYSHLDISNLESISGTRTITWQEGLENLLRQI